MQDKACVIIAVRPAESLTILLPVRKQNLIMTQIELVRFMTE
jgi:hypothetical protein